MAPRSHPFRPNGLPGAKSKVRGPQPGVPMRVPCALSPLALLLFTIVTTCPAKAQDEAPSVVTDQNRSGDLPFSSVVGTNLEHVVVASGDLVVNIPIIHTKGRNGLDFDFGLRYDGRLLSLVQRGPNNAIVWTFSAANYVPNGGIWQTNQPTLSYHNYTRTACLDVGGSGNANGSNGYVLQDPQGAKHLLSVNYENAECPGGSWSYANSGPDGDDQGFWGSMPTPGAPVTIIGPNGMIFPKSSIEVGDPTDGFVFV